MMPERVSPYVLERRGDGRFEVSWHVTTGRGARRRRSRLVRCADPTDMTQAEKWFRSWRGPDVDAKPADCSVSEAFQVYLRDHSRPKGQETSDRNATKAAIDVFGAYSVSAIEPGDIKAFVARRLRKVKAQTVARELRGLQAALNWYLRHVAHLDKRYAFEKPSGAARRDEWLDEHQERKVMDALPDAPRDVQIFVTLGLTYGVRRGAMLDLRFGDQINWRAGTIDFNVPGAPKLRKRRPIVHMTDEVRDLLSRRMAEIGGGPVMDGETTLRRYRTFMEGLGLGWATPHVLKHSAITLMLRGGAKIEDVARLTNTDPRTLYDTYRHHSRDEMIAVTKMRAG